MGLTVGLSLLLACGERGVAPASLRAEPVVVSVPSAVPSAAPAPPPAAPSASATASARRVADLQAKLVALGPLLDFTVPIEQASLPKGAESIIRELEDASLAVIAADLPTALRRPGPDALAASFRAAGVTWVGPGETSHRGAISAGFTPAAGHRERWVVELFVDMGHQGGTTLAVFERRQGRVRLAMVERAPRLRAVEDVRVARVWSISPPGPRDEYFLVTGSTFPWIASCWRTLTLRVLAPGKAPSSPVQLLKAEEDTFWCNGWELDASRTGFSLEYDGHDAQQVYRRRRRRWKRVGAKFRRTDDRLVHEGLVRDP